MMFAVVMLALFADSVLNPFKITEVAAEGEITNSIEVSELYTNTQARAAIANPASRKEEFNGEDRNSQEIAASRDRRSSDGLDEYIDEFKSLEEQYCSSKFPLSCETFSEPNEDHKFLSLYESLLEKISEYALIVQNSNEKKIVRHLYTATLGRIYNLENHLESTLVENITSYFEAVKYDFEKLKDLKNENYKKDITNKHKREYKTVIDKKIKHANDLISEEILDEIDYIKTEIDDEIENLITDVLELQNQARKDTYDIRDKRIKLRKAILFQAFLGPLKVLGQVLSFIGRAGEVAGSAIEFGISLAETSILEISGIRNDVRVSEKSMTDLKSLQDQISKFSDLKVNGLKKTLDFVSQEIHNNPEAISAVFFKVADIRSKLDAIVKNNNNIKEVQDLEIELKTMLQNEKKEIIKAQLGATDGAVASLDHLLQSLQLSSVTLDTIYKYQESPRKLSKIRRAVQQNEKRNFILKEYEDKIYTTMLPLLENIKIDLDDIRIKIDNDDMVVFDVSKWDVKNTLKDLKHQLQNVTLSFRVQGNLKRYLAKFQDAIFTLINMQDYIQDYQKDKILANFIADISSVTVNEVDVSYSSMLEEYLRDTLRDLEITVRANIAMQRYKVAIDAFKQFIFPEAHVYLKIPIYPSLANNKLDRIIHTAINHFEVINSELRLEKITLRRMDACKGSGSFYDRYVSARPFFTWKKQTSQYMFSKLLSGKEVIVKADVVKSSPNHDALKFSKVQFQFKTTKGVAKEKLSKILKGFLIHATYLGDSYYRYGNEIYLMTPAANFSIWHSLSEERDGKPIPRSHSFDKFKDEDNAILSPYATWKLKLERTTDEVSFTDLEIFKYQHKLKLMLEGSARYVMASQHCVDLMVDKYYKAVN